MLRRYSGSLVIGASMTFVLLFIMQSAIDRQVPRIEEPPSAPSVDLVRTILEPEPVKKTPPEPPPPVESPPDVPVPSLTPDPHETTGIWGIAPPPATDPDISPQSGGDGTLLPYLRPGPVYPDRAAQRGIEGWVLVEFTVDERGRVVSPSVIDANPKGYFERAALNALERYKYRPQVVNGLPVAVSGLRQRILFDLEG